VHKKFIDFLDENLRLSKSGFYLFSPISILAVPLTLAAATYETSWIFGTLIGLLLTAITFFIYRVATFITAKRGCSNSWKTNLLLIAVTGILRGATFFALLELFEITQPSPLIQRLLNSTFVALIWLTIANVAIEVNRRYKRKYRAILSQMMIMNFRNNEGVDAGFATIAEELSILQEGLRETYSAAEKSSASNAAMKKVAEELHLHIESALKPISKRLWLTSAYKFPQLKFRRLIIDAITQLRYPTFLVSFTLAFSGLVLLAPEFGWRTSLKMNVIGFFSLLIVEYLRNKLTIWFSQLSKAINFFFVFTVGIFSSALTTIVLRIYDGSGSYLLGILISPYASALIITASAITLALSDRRLILENLTREVNEISQSALLPFQSSQAASYIHNSLQSELTVLAHEFESVAAKPESGSSEALMEKLDALIRRSISEDFANFLESPAIRLERVLDSWKQIIELTTSIDQSLFTDSARGNLFVQLIEESLANSVRKGRATKVNISATLRDNQLLVEINDNGTFDQSSTPGMGSAWIERHSVGDWNFEVTSSGTTLRVEL
jgi:signal transduction histidine kinase